MVRPTDGDIRPAGKANADAEEISEDREGAGPSGGGRDMQDKARRFSDLMARGNGRQSKEGFARPEREFGRPESDSIDEEQRHSGNDRKSIARDQSSSMPQPARSVTNEARQSTKSQAQEDHESHRPQSDRRDDDRQEPDWQGRRDQRDSNSQRAPFEHRADEEQSRDSRNQAGHPGTEMHRPAPGRPADRRGADAAARTTSPDANASPGNGDEQGAGPTDRSRSSRSDRGEQDPTQAPLGLAATVGANVLNSMGNVPAPPVAASAQPMAAAHEVDELVKEIAQRVLVTKEPLKNAGEVRITMQDGVLPGTEVRVSHEGGRLLVNFVTSSHRSVELLGRVQEQFQTQLGAAIKEPVVVKVEHRESAQGRAGLADGQTGGGRDDGQRSRQRRRVIDEIDE